MRTVKKQATYLGLKYQPQYGWLTINLGAEIFRLFKNSMFIDETPYSDETLVPIKNVTVKNKIFSFGRNATRELVVTKLSKKLKLNQLKGGLEYLLSK